MSDPITISKSARESLSKGLNALQADPTVPKNLVELAAPIAQAMGALHQLEKANQLAPHADVALNHLRGALAQLQGAPPNHPAVASALDSVAKSLTLVHSLTRMAQGAPPIKPNAPAAPARPAPPPAAPKPIAAPVALKPPSNAGLGSTVAMAQPMAQPPPKPAAPVAPPPPAPPVGVQNLAPAFPPPAPFSPQMAPPPQAPHMPPPQVARDPFAAPQRDPFAGHGAPPPQPGMKPATPSMPVPAPAPAGNMQLIPADLGAHSSTNFYKGLSGNDIIDHGGLFISTYVPPKIGTPVRLKVSLPGGYEFEANAVVKWTRESGGDGEPGFGARFTAITPEARQLVYRYVRNREPLFYDDF